jgi:hypothetical protein
MWRHGCGLGLALVLDLVLFVPTVKADLHCEQPVHQAGTVRTGMPLAHRFAFVNRGSASVEIIDIRSTCGCVTPKLEKRTYAPGERGTLLLEVNTLALAQGKQSWRTQLICRAGETTSELDLTLVGDVVTEVQVQPAALTLPAEVVGHEITVTDRRASPLTVLKADAGSPCLKATVGEPGLDAGVTVQKVRLEVPPDCLEGRHDVALHLYTNDPAYREFKVPVIVVKRPRSRVHATPTQVTFEGDRGQPLPSRLVRLIAADGETVEIERVEATDPAVRCTWAKGPGTAATVKLQIDPARGTTELQATIRVHFLNPAGETLVIPVSWSPR